ncbi:MAG: pectate lyase [Bacteroides sp.]|nr:pectate lyase [Prevotella sp.]MCM1470635.1 pectate lyase [Bacteroides sp.]
METAAPLFGAALCCFAAVMLSCAANAQTASAASSENAAADSIRREALEKNYEPVSLSRFADSVNHARYSYKDSVPPYEIYTERQIAGIAENMLYMQNPDGGWAKNYDYARKYSQPELEKLRASLRTVKPVAYGKKQTARESTLDNRNIYSQIEYLSLVYGQLPDPRYIDCMERALEWILGAQHPRSGGFTGADVYAVTYNDDVMTGTLRVLRDIAENSERYGFFSDDSRRRAAAAYRRGIDCILNTQIAVRTADGGKILTAWCQQHDHETLEPIWARTFEPPSVTACESVGIIELLMEEKNPSEQVKIAVASACEWLSRPDIIIKGKKLVRKSAAAEVLNGRYSDYEQILEDDENAPDLWARFYDLETMAPLWCDRDRRFCASFNDMSRERRNGYSYTGKWPQKILKKYPAWRAAH